MFDLMHTLVLGILQRIYPAVLQPLLKPSGRQAPAFEGSTVQKRCEAATRDYHAFVRNAGVYPRVKRITEAWVKPKKWGQPVQLSQSHGKAAALRRMLPWLLQVCEAHAEGEEGALRSTLLRELLRMDEAYSAVPGRFLPPEAQRAAAGHCAAALDALRQLAVLAPGRWRLQPKAHALTHIAYDALMNPRVVHCYQDEDFVGRAKRTWGRCHGLTAQRRVLEHYVMHSTLRLSSRLDVTQNVRADRNAPAGASAPAGAGRARGARKAKPAGRRGR